MIVFLPVVSETRGRAGLTGGGPEPPQKPQPRGGRVPWPERSPLPAGPSGGWAPPGLCLPPWRGVFGVSVARPERLRAVCLCGGVGGVCPSPSGAVPQPALLEAINVARAAGATLCLSCRVSLGRAGAAFLSLGAQSRPRLLGPLHLRPLRDPECPRCLQPRVRAGREGKAPSGPLRPRGCPGPGAPAPALPRRASLGIGSPSDGSSAISSFRSGRGAAAASAGSGGDGTGTGSGLTGAGAGAAPRQDRSWGGGALREGETTPCPGERGGKDPRGFRAGSRGGGDGRDRLLGAPGLPGPSRPVPQQRGHGEPPALRGPHGDGAERERGGGVRRPEQVSVGRGLGPEGASTYCVQNQNFLSKR